MTYPSPSLSETISLNDIIQEVARRAHYADDDERALSHLRTVFRVIRDRATFEQSLRFLEMLPLPLKAVFLNDWHINPQRPVSLASLDEWAEAVCQSEWQHPISNPAEARRVLHAVFEVLIQYTTPSQLHDSLSFLPPEAQGQLTNEGAETYHYQDACIWLS